MNKRERWFLIGGVALGLVLGGARCSFHQFDSKPGCKADWQITTGGRPA